MIAARPTTYKGIKMRSRLEARYAAVLDAWSLPWSYEPRAYGGDRGQYLPDFVIPAESDHHTIYIEVRPTLDRALLALTQMPVIWESDGKAVLQVTVPDLPIRYEAGPHTGAKWWVVPVEPWS